MNKIGIGIVAGVVVIAGGWYAYSKQHEQNLMMQQKASEEKMMMEQKVMEQKQMDDKKAMESDKMMEQKDGAMMEKKDGAMMEGGEAMMKGSYEAYSPEKISWAEHGKVVLFFNASWCPTCRGLDAELKAQMANIPEGTFIFSVDYDKSADLKQKYGVTTQHTLVQVDAKGNMINKWSGGGKLSDVIKNIK